MIKFKDIILPKLDKVSSKFGTKVIQGDYKPRTKEELKELESLEGIEVNGILDLRGTKIYTLPDNVKVHHLFISNTKINKLPKNLEVKYSLSAENTLIKKLPEDFHTSYENIKVEGNINFNNTNLTELPNNFIAPINLHIAGTKIKEMPYNLIIGSNLYLGNTPLAHKYLQRELVKLLRGRGGRIGGNIFKNNGRKRPLKTPYTS